jgi:hypothetical protein
MNDVAVESACGLAAKVGVEDEGGATGWVHGERLHVT